MNYNPVSFRNISLMNPINEQKSFQYPLQPNFKAELSDDSMDVPDEEIELIRNDVDFSKYSVAIARHTERDSHQPESDMTSIGKLKTILNQVTKTNVSSKSAKNLNKSAITGKASSKPSLQFDSKHDLLNKYLKSQLSPSNLRPKTPINNSKGSQGSTTSRPAALGMLKRDVSHPNLSRNQSYLNFSTLDPEPSFTIGDRPHTTKSRETPSNKNNFQQKSTNREENDKSKLRGKTPDDQVEHLNNMMKRNEAIEEKKRMKKEELMMQQRENYTFQPQTNSKSPLRSFGQFLEAQNKFVKQKETNCQNLKTKLEAEKKSDEVKPKPEINKKTQEIANKKKTEEKWKKEVHQRLFEHSKYREILYKNSDSKEEKQLETTYFIKKPKVGIDKENCSFRPNISEKSQKIQRDKKIEDILYQDAIRRKQSNADIKPKSQQIKYTSNKSDAYVANKFTKEFVDATSQFFEDGKEHRFDFKQLIDFMKKMHFVQNSQDQISQYAQNEKHLLEEMWHILQGDKFNGINERNLLVFILAILGLKVSVSFYVKPEENRASHESLATNKAETMRKDGSEASEHDIFCQTYQVFPLEKDQNTKIGRSSGNSELNKLKLDDKQSEHPDIFNFNSPTSAIIHHIDYQNKSEIRYEGSADHPESLGISNILKNDSSFQDSKRKDNLNDDTANRSTKILGELKDGENINFTEDEIMKIFKKFDIFYINKLFNTSHETHEYMNSSFMPEIAENSRNLAIQYREKQLENVAKVLTDRQINPPPGGLITHADLLNFQKLSKEDKIKDLKKQYDEKAMKDCTFKPRTNANTDSISDLSKRSQVDQSDFEDKTLNYIPSHRGEKLYKMAKSNKSKSDKSFIEFDFEKNSKECTFKPSINKSNNSITHSRRESIENPKDAEKVIERLKKGRDQRNYIRKALERGEVTNDSFDEKRSFKFNLDDSKREHNRSASRIKNLSESEIENEQNKFQSQGRSKSAISVKAPASIINDMNKKTNIDLPLQTKEKNNRYIKADDSHMWETEPKEEKVYSSTKDSEKVEDRDLVRESSKTPILFVDVNFGGGKQERIIVYEGDTSDDIAERFARANELDDEMRYKLKLLLDNHMARLLSKIEEERPSIQSDIS